MYEASPHFASHLIRLDKVKFIHLREIYSTNARAACQAKTFPDGRMNIDQDSRLVVQAHFLFNPWPSMIVILVRAVGRKRTGRTPKNLQQL